MFVWVFWNFFFPPLTEYKGNLDDWLRSSQHDKLWHIYFMYRSPRFKLIPFSEWDFKTISSEMCNLLTCIVWTSPLFPVQYDAYSVWACPWLDKRWNKSDGLWLWFSLCVSYLKCKGWVKTEICEAPGCLLLLRDIKVTQLSTSDK